MKNSQFTRFLKFAVLPLFFVLSFQLWADGWYDSAWKYRKEIVIDSSSLTLVPDVVNYPAEADGLNDFPFLINISDAGDSLFDKAKTSGADILFTADDGVTKISHEIDTYNPGGHLLLAWVKIHKLPLSGTVSVYLYYGNSSSDDQQERTAVWDSGYQMVLHLNEQVINEGTSGQHFDSTSHAANGYQSGNSTTTGVVGNAQYFDGSAGSIDDYITLDNIPTNDWTALTLEVWFKWNGTLDGGETFPLVVSKADGTDLSNFVFGLAIDDTNKVLNPVLNTDTPQNDLYGTTVIPIPSWVHTAYSWAGTASGDSFKLYFDGENDPLDPGDPTPFVNGTDLQDANVDQNFHHREQRSSQSLDVLPRCDR